MVAQHARTAAGGARPFRRDGTLPDYPLGSDFTPVEQRLVKALGCRHTDGRLATLRTLLAALAGSALDHEALQRMQLDAPARLRERLAARLVAHALRQA